MPRTAKRTMSGERAQPVGPVAAQQYGAGVDQAELQRQLPAPQATPVAPGPPPVAPGAAGPGSAERLEQALQQMQVGDGLMTAPTARPLEPVTAGLASGPGPGPEALGMGRVSPLATTFENLSRDTGDPYFAELARKAGLM